MARVVVCDDDAVVRAAITTVCEEAGLQVVAETDSAGDAAEMVRRFGVDVLVLDLALTDGTGERALEMLDADAGSTAVVVFTSFADDAMRLLRKGAREVVEKPDFEQLSDVLSQVATSVDTSARAEERRIASREVSAASEAWRSPSGVSSRPDLAHSIEEVEVGDFVLAVTVVGLEGIEADAGPLLAADCRLAVAAALRSQLRIQDLLHEAPEVSGFVALLRGGDARAATAVWSRLEGELGDAWSYGEVKGAASRVDAMGVKDAIARAIGGLQSAAPGSSPYLSV